MYIWKFIQFKNLSEIFCFRRYMTDAAQNFIQSLNQSIDQSMFYWLIFLNNIYGLLRIVYQIHVITKIDQEVDGIFVQVFII